MSDFAGIPDHFERGNNRIGRRHPALFCADRGLSRVIIYFDCQHARCCFDGRFGLRRTGVSRHALDCNHRPIHVRGELVARCEEPGNRLRKEEKTHRDDGHRPEHELVKRHDR